MERRRWHAAYDEGTPTSVPYENTTLVDNLDRAAADFPHRTAIIFLNGSITYAQLLDQVERFATALNGLVETAPNP